MILDQFKLDGKIAIVTGAAQGLGQGIAAGLAEAGADLALVDILDMTATRKKIEALGRRCVTITANLMETTCIGTIIDTTVKELGGIDILFNNAGIIRRAPITEFTEKDWDDVMNINIRTLFFLSQAAGKVMIEQGRGGKIVNTASMLSFQGGILVPSYTASKSAVMGLTRLLANELGAHDINVNAIAPGLHGHGEHQGAARGSSSQQGHPGPHPRRALGDPAGPAGRGRVSGLGCITVHTGLHHRRGRRLVGSVKGKQ